MRASELAFKSAVVFALIGMAMGIAMAASHDHSVFPAHAHLNLIGWLSLFVIGFYFRSHPPLDASRLAIAQVGVWVLGTIALTIGVGAINLGHLSAEPIAVVGAFVILADMLVFAVLVFRSGRVPGAPELAAAEVGEAGVRSTAFDRT